jgi:hypothetical protein
MPLEGSHMEYRLYFYDYFGNVRGLTPFETSDDAAANVIADRFARLATGRRSELWAGERLVMRRSFPEENSTNQVSD